MRVVAGAFRSRILKAPAGSQTRPTTDRARETLFNILGNIFSFEGIRVLDLFAGSGALAIEALSRGAREAVFVEKDHRAIDAIKQNVNALELNTCARISSLDVYLFLKKEASSYDLIFADAPYDDVRALTESPIHNSYAEVACSGRHLYYRTSV